MRAPGERFEFVRVLGRGSGGVVRLARDRDAGGAVVAVKDLGEPGELFTLLASEGAAATSGGGAPNDRERAERALLREFAMLSSLRHPNLVEVYELESGWRRAPRFSMEFVEGSDLVRFVEQEPERCPELAAEALRALAFLHDFRIFHADLKPANVLVRDVPRGGARVVLLDFGMARAVATDGSEGESGDGRAARGTMAYVAPERFAGEPPSIASDLYGLGAVLYEAIRGRPPVDPESVPDLARFVDAVRSGRRDPPPVREGVPAGFAEWVDDLIAPDPARRPSDAREAQARLDAACGTTLPIETPAGRLARLRSGAPAERAGEIAALWRALDPSAGPRVCWLIGEPGYGKSRVLRWLEVDAALRDWHVVKVDRVNERRGADVPDLDALRESAARRPTLVVLDEVERAGPAIVDLLGRVAREPSAPPLQVVAAARRGSPVQPELVRLVRSIDAVPSLVRVDLGRIGEEGLRAMASRALGGTVAGERVRWLLESSEGIPTVAEALLVEGAWERRSEPTPGAPRDPRLDLLGPDATAWLEALAVLGGGGVEATLADLADLTIDRARAAADEVESVGLATRDDGVWRPDSRKLAETVRGAIEPERAVVLHRRAAEALDRDGSSDRHPWRRARLALGAGEVATAIEHAVRAAEVSSDRGDPAEAARRFGEALRWLPRRDPERGTLRRMQAEAFVAAGLHDAAARAYGALVRLERDPRAREDARARQAHALVRSGKFESALRAAHRAATGAATIGDAVIEGAARYAEGLVLARTDAEREAIPVLETALERLEGSGERALEGEVRHSLANCKLRLWQPGAEADLRNAIESYRRSARGRLRPALLKAQIGLAILRSRARQFDEAARLLDHVRGEAAERGWIGLQETALARLATVAVEEGRLDVALARGEEAADLARYLGDADRRLDDECMVADALIRSGRAGEVLARLRAVLERPLDHVEPQRVDYARMILADAWMEAGGGDAGQIRELAVSALEGCTRRRKRRPWMMALVIEMERRAVHGGVEPLDPIRVQFEALLRASDDPVEPEITIRAALATARARLSIGNLEGARESVSEALQASTSIGSAAFEARAASLMSEVLERSGSPVDAADVRARGRRRLEAAAERIADPEVRETFLSRPVYAALRPALSSRAAGRDDRRRLEALYDMIRVLNSATDADVLLQSILDMALRAVGAERGMILLRDDDRGPDGFAVRLARGLEDETVRDAEEYSRSIVSQAGTGRSLISLDAGNDERFRELESVTLFGIRSLMCVPLRSRGAVIGTVYLDSRKDGELFTAEDLRFLEAFADHAALALDNTRTRARLERENRHLQAIAETRTRFENLVGQSNGMQVVFDLIDKVAATDLPVLVHGESGTGKELVARAIHFHGDRCKRPFVIENCAAIPDTLLESELFGHVRGAFTGADRDRVGLFEQAHGGTLFLDEVGDMSAAMQAKLLRALQDGEVRRVGSAEPVRVDVRVVAATHRDLVEEVRAGNFREDLMYRLRVLAIEIPPLRERPGDVGLLVDHFLARIARERGRSQVVIRPEAVDLLERHRWPGNVRELENTLQRLVLLAAPDVDTSTFAADPELRSTFLEAGGREPALSLRHSEREQIRRALDEAKGNRTRAAKLLGISRATIYRKLQQYDLG